MEEFTLDHEPDAPKGPPPGYATDLHKVELTRRDIDIAAMGVARELGLVDLIEALDGVGYAIRDREVGLSTLETLLNLSESLN